MSVTAGAVQAGRSLTQPVVLWTAAVALSWPAQELGPRPWGAAILFAGAAAVVGRGAWRTRQQGDALAAWVWFLVAWAAAWAAFDQVRAWAIPYILELTGGAGLSAQQFGLAVSVIGLITVTLRLMPVWIMGRWAAPRGVPVALLLTCGLLLAGAMRVYVRPQSVSDSFDFPVPGLVLSGLSLIVSLVEATLLFLFLRRVEQQAIRWSRAAWVLTTVLLVGMVVRAALVLIGNAPDGSLGVLLERLWPLLSVPMGWIFGVGLPLLVAYLAARPHREPPITARPDDIGRVTF